MPKEIKWVLQLREWQGQRVIRDLPERRYHLRLDTSPGRGSVRSWEFSRNPIRYLPLGGFWEGWKADKWFKFEGEIEPQSEYNTNRRIKARMEIIDSGRAIYHREELEGRTVILLRMEGVAGMSGEYELRQDSVGSDTYTLSRHK